MPRLTTALKFAASGLYLMQQRQRVAALAELVRMQRTELNYMRCELRALGSLLHVPEPESEPVGRHLHSM